jgi:predicted permease
MLFKTPFVTGVAVVSLALGIGANAAIFSLFNQLLLRPLPVDEPGRLVNFLSPGPKQGSTSTNNAGNTDAVFSYPMFRDLEREQTSFTALAAHRLFGATIAYGGQTEFADALYVSGGYFPALGVLPAAGRLLGAGDDRTIGEAAVAVLAHHVWTDRFDRRQSVVGETIAVNGQPLTIVGVAPEGFSGTTVGERVDVFVPITLRGRLESTFAGFENRRDYWVYLFARLESSVAREAAETAINGPYRAVIQTIETPLLSGVSDATRDRFHASAITLLDGARGQSQMHEQASPYLLTLFAVTGVVLLIACANIANLLLARSAARAGEMAVRLSIGASRAQLVRQLLLEACLLALMGGAAGLVVARATIGGILSMLPADASRVLDPRLDVAVVVFSAALAIATGILFGLFPALQSTRPDLASTLKGVAGQPGSARAATLVRKSLVALQITLSMGLLASAGLFLKSLVNVTRVDLGLNVDRLATFRIAPRVAGYSAERAQALYERLEAELSALPGVEAVTAATVPILAGSSSSTNVSVQGFDAGPDTNTQANLSEVGPGYFSAVGIPLLAGREFTAADTAGAPPVVIVNEAFLQKFNLGRDAVGTRMERGRSTPPRLDLEIVGIVGNARYSRVRTTPPPIFYTPYRQNAQGRDVSFYVRTTREPESVLGAVRETMRRIDPNLPLVNLRTMPDQIRQNITQDRFISTLATTFAALATVLASVGLYGVLAYTVSQRTREFGLRMALGANAGRVRGLVLGQMAWLLGIGAAAGLALAAVVAGLAGAAGLLFEMQGQTIPVFAAAAALVAVIALAAAFFPALRASRIDPMRALRYE